MADARIAAAVASAASPMETTGAAFMLHPDTFEASGAHGYEHPFQGYFAGRGGMLGDISTEELTKIFYSFPQEVVGMFWEPGKALHGAEGGSDRYQQQVADWAEKHLAGVDGLARYAELGEKVIAKAGNVGAVSSAWAKKPRSSSPAAHALQVLMILRELRADIHFNSLRGSGIEPKAAHLLNQPGFAPNRPGPGTDYAGLFGWSEPWPDVTPLKGKWDEIEEATQKQVSEIYASALSADEAEEFAKIAQAINAKACPAA